MPKYMQNSQNQEEVEVEELSRAEASLVNLPKKNDSLPRRLSTTHQSIVDWDKNPPSAPPPELIAEHFDLSVKRGKGRPKFYETPEEFAERTAAYFTSKMLPILDDETGVIVGYRWSERLTMSGLALWLHMDRRTLVNYSHRDEYFDVVNSAREIIQNATEIALFENRNPAGPIFTLKNGFGWKDVSDIRVSEDDPLGDRKSEADIEAYAKRLQDNVAKDSR